jgi:hypothetical protein
MRTHTMALIIVPAWSEELHQVPFCLINSGEKKISEEDTHVEIGKGVKRVLAL